MDVIILIGLIVLFVFLFKKTFSSFVYAVAVVDIFLRILAYLKIKLMSGSIYGFFNSNFPSDIPSVINKYTNYEFSVVLIWAYVVLMIVFEFYIIRTFMKKR